MNEENNTQDNAEGIVFPVIRHAIQAGGALLAGQGYISTDQSSIVVGALMSIAALLWGICKRKGVKVCR